MHINESPTAREPSPITAIEEHHPGDDADVVLPSVTELMPPFAADDFVRVDLVDGPEVLVVFVEEDGLEDVVLVAGRAPWRRRGPGGIGAGSWCSRRPFRSCCMSSG